MAVSILVIILILLLLGAFPAWNYGGPGWGGSWAGVVVVLLVLVLLGLI